MTPNNQPSSQPTLYFTLAPFFGATLVGLMIASITMYALRTTPTPLHSAPTPLRTPGYCEEQEQQPEASQLEAWQKWSKPNVALVLSGQMHGYIDPCGCSDPQYGGLIRRFNFVQSLKDKGWNVVGIDLGELAQVQGNPAQNKLKFDLSVKALGKMNYRALGIGRDEMLIPLGAGLAQIWDEKHVFPRPLGTTLDKTDPKQTYHDLNVRRHEIIDANPKIGVISVIGPDLQKEMKGIETFRNNLVEIPAALKALAAAKVEVGVILQHEHPQLDPEKFPKGGLNWIAQVDKQRKAWALELAQLCAAERKKNRFVPEIHLIMILTESPAAVGVLRQLSPALPTQIVEVGHKGKSVGLVGIYRTRGGFDFEYEPVEMGPKWKPTNAQLVNNPVIGLFENYYKELKSQDMLANHQRVKHPNQVMPGVAKGLKATYVGSERCGDCHGHAHTVWTKSKHFIATETLEKLKAPAGRHFDPECMKCHTTGLEHPGGYANLVTDLAIWPFKPMEAPTGKKIKKHDENLRGVGCESCHGPGSEHVKDKDNKDLHSLINPYGPTLEERQLEQIAKRNVAQQERLQELRKSRMNGLNIFCMKCHNDENDVHWGEQGREILDNWMKIIHRSPKNNNGGVIPPPANKGEGPQILEPPLGGIEIIQDKKQ